MMSSLYTSQLVFTLKLVIVEVQESIQLSQGDKFTKKSEGKGMSIVPPTDSKEGSLTIFVISHYIVSKS